MINHTQAEAIGILTNVLCQLGVFTLIAKFLILDIPIDRDALIVVGQGFLHTIGGIVNTLERLFSTFDRFCHQTFHAARSDVMRNAESGSDDEEEYEIKRNKFGAPIYGLKPTPYLNCNDPAEQSTLTGSLIIRVLILKKKKQQDSGTMGTHDDEAESSRSNALDNMKSWKRHVYSPCVVNWDVLNRMGCDGEIVDMLRIKLQLCHEFYSTYEFDEVCVDDELQTTKIIKFRLGGRAHNLTLLEFAHRLGLYHADELKEDGFNVYFEGGLCSDEHFNAQEYWLSISREENLSLSRSHTSTIRSPNLRVIHKMITYGLCQRMTRKSRVLIDDVVRSLSAPIYCRDLDTTPLRDLIDSEGRLILEDPQPGVPRVGIPRPPRASMQDLYDRMGRMEIRQEAIEGMKYRQSYH
ncbi:hypothetical protein Tco_0570609 [Tanacetum coccineum]